MVLDNRVIIEENDTQLGENFVKVLHVSHWSRVPLAGEKRVLAILPSFLKMVRKPNVTPPI